MKSITFLSVVLSASIVYGQQLPVSVRHFMQQVPSAKNQIPYGANAEAGHYIKSGDARIYYEVYGSGQPIVILHGGVFGSTFEMHEFIDSLKKTNQVIAISTRGHGKSEIGSGLPTNEKKALDVNAVIGQVTKDSVIVLGFSDGAYTGYYFSIAYPQKIKKLIAIGAGEWQKGFRDFKLSRKQFVETDSLYYKQQLGLMPNPQLFDEWLKGMGEYYNSLSIGKEILNEIRCPVLVMAGEEDKNAPLTSILRAYEMIPDARLSIVPAAPHPVFLVNFKAVWYGMQPFLHDQ